MALRVYNTLTRSKELFQKKHAYVADGDILGGGMDLIFPHHENEIAQSEAYSGKPFVKYWLHNGMVHFGADKMSKSLGNVVPTNDLIEKYSGEVVRFYILTGCSAVKNILLTRPQCETRLAFDTESVGTCQGYRYARTKKYVATQTLSEQPSSERLAPLGRSTVELLQADRAGPK